MERCISEGLFLWPDLANYRIIVCKKYPKTYRGQEISIKGGDSMSIEEMKNVDVWSVYPETLVDVTQIVIDESLPKEERVKEYLRQVKNPYCFKAGDAVVKCSYSLIRSYNGTVEEGSRCNGGCFFRCRENLRWRRSPVFDILGMG